MKTEDLDLDLDLDSEENARVADGVGSGRVMRLELEADELLDLLPSI